jgi:enterochelin esterase family protein
MNNWNLSESPALIRLEGTDLWYLAAEFEPEARLDYKFVLNGSDWRLDPLNPQTMQGGFGPNSQLAMPGYVPPPELQPATQDIPAGTVETHTINSRHLNQTRTFFVYRPPGQLVGEKLPSVYFHDGSDYLNIINAPVLLDRLIAGRQIPPLVAVFIPPINRSQDYRHNEAYVQFLAEELVPFIQANFATDPAPDKTATLGASLGGLAAVHAAASRPDVFGLAAGQSGAYSLDGDAVVRQIAGQGAEISSTPGVRFYLVVGSYEMAVSGNSQEGDLLAANRRLVKVLEDKGYDYFYEELPQGHSWGLWQATIGQALGYLLG